MATGFKIGNLAISHPCILSPLSGISDLPFRMISRSLGCEFAFAEMVSARALVWSNRKTDLKLSTSPADTPSGVQLLGRDLEVIRKAMAILLEKYRFDVIDFNAACPGNKVANRGEGAGLLKEPARLSEILKAMVAMSPTTPVTVKIRIGWDDSSVNAPDVARAAQDAGVKALFIHGRTRKQQYGGTVNYQVIRDVKKALAIPVIASGDGLSARLVKKMFDETGCDGVAIARGALGNPWIFNETKTLLRTGILPAKPAIDEIISIMIKHLELYCGFYGERVGVIIFRKFFHWYSREQEGIRHLRQQVFLAKTKEQMIEMTHRLRDIVRPAPASTG